jgi:hypothetical protein
VPKFGKAPGVLAAELIVREAREAAATKRNKRAATLDKVASAAPRDTPSLPGGMAPVGGPRDVNRGPPDFSGAPSPESRDSQSLVLRPQSIGTFPSAPERAIAQKEREAKLALQTLVRKCREHTSAAVDVLVDVMTRSTHAPSRVAAAKAVIEFGNGKAPETVRMERVFSADEMRALAEAIILRRSKESIDGGRLGGAVLEPKR